MMASAEHQLRPDQLRGRHVTQRYQVFLARTVTGTVMSSVILSFLGDSLLSGPAVTVVVILMVYAIVGIGLYAKELPPWFEGRELAENDPHGST